MESIRAEVERELGRVAEDGDRGTVMPRVVEVWADAVGATVARYAWPARIARDGTLHVATDSAAWAFELQQLERDVAASLAAALGDHAPERLRFTVGQLPEAGPAAADVAHAGPTPSAEHRELAAALAAPIEDSELRELVARAAAQSLARAASDRSF